MSNGKVKVGDGEYNMSELTDVVQLQAKLVPDNWPLEKREGVRLFLSLQEMAAFELKKHLAHNFKNILRIANDQQADGEGAEVAVAFGFKIDVRSPMVAAIAGQKMAFSQKFSSTTKPVTHDLNQGDFMDQLTDVLNANIDLENAPPPEPPTAEEEAENDKEASTGDAEHNEDADSEKIVNLPGNEPTAGATEESKPARKPRKSKKNAKK